MSLNCFSLAVPLPEMLTEFPSTRRNRLGEKVRKRALSTDSTNNSGNAGLGSEWNRHFPEFHSEILGLPREVGLKFRKIGITGKFRSIRPFLLGPSFSEPGNRNSTLLILKLLNIILVLYETND